MAWFDAAERKTVRWGLIVRLRAVHGPGLRAMCGERIKSFLRHLRVGLLKCTSLGRRLVDWRLQRRIRSVPLERLLMGQEAGIPAAVYSRYVDDPMRPSTPVAHSPHVKLLEQYVADGANLFQRDVFHKTDYYRSACKTIDIAGNYFEARSEDQIVDVARRFVAWFRGVAGTATGTQPGRSAPGSPVIVQPVRFSNCYQVVDGHHRLAIQCARGASEASVLPVRSEVLTPIQSTVLDVVWTAGRRELYQPIDAPELQTWPLVRRCSDRLEKMREFLRDEGIQASSGSSYLDVGSSYGWFVSQMLRLGFDACGVEMDPVSASIGPMAYGLDPARVHVMDSISFLRSNSKQFTVTSCFSVIHVFATGKKSISAEEFIRLVDLSTEKAMFIDTGQNHETWYRESLAQWDEDFIHDWLLRNTSFHRIERLGVDQDAVPPFEDSYSRMLFACTR